MVVEVKNLTKRFADFTAVDNISFSMNKAEIVGFLGPNGAGKTTTIHMLLDLITPSSGEIFVFGKNLRENREEILQNVNFASPYVSLPYRLTVFENLMVFAHMYNIPTPKKRISELLEMFEIADLRDELTGSLSSGQNTRVGLCKSLLNKPKLLLLDEPTASLDPEISHHAREILLSIREHEKTSILYTSHNMAETEKICDRIVFLNHGKIIAEGTPIEITKAILSEERKEPALEEVFFRVIKNKPYENT